MADNLSNLTRRLIEFRDARDWRQFHSLGNLIVSLNLEASELLELTQWKDDDALAREIKGDDFKSRLAEECADVLCYLLMIAETADVDLVAAAHAKIDKNGDKYPVDKSQGRSTKYTDL